MRVYTVRGAAEEFDCPHCGAPVFNGDNAVEHKGDCFCSKRCAAYRDSDREHNATPGYHPANGFPQLGTWEE